MSELLIAVSILPVVLVVLGKQTKVTSLLIWIPPLVAALCVANSLYLHSADPNWWLPVASFAALALSELLENKKISVFLVLCLLFVAQGLLSSEIGNIVICLAIADMFLNLELFMSGKVAAKNSAIHNVYKSLFSFFPVLLGILLQLKGDSLTATVLLTIIMRLFSWPVMQWHSSGSPFSGLLITAGSTFALWHVTDFSGQPYWALVLLCIAAVFSLGASYAELFLALGLGGFCISPTFGVIATMAWPLLVHRGRATYLVILLAGSLGLLICDFSTKFLLENAVYAIACIGALLLARPFVAIKFNSRSWLKEAADTVLFFGLIGAFLYTNQIPKVAPSPVGLTFVIVFFLAYFVGLFLVRQKPRIFAPMRAVEIPVIFDPDEPLNALKEVAGAEILFKDRKYLNKMYAALESETHLAWLLGALGLALLWGMK
jgi:hypothetical protein